MSAYYACPHCTKSFHFGDGYPDLYGLRLCSVTCQEAWLIAKKYRSSLSDPVSLQTSDDVAQQVGDSSGGLQSGDPFRLEDPTKQMS
jgi:hypothetical protein